MKRTPNIIILALMLLAFGPAAKAQSTALAPYEGATHTYTWNGLQQGDTYDFYLTASADGTGLYADDETAEFDFAGDASGTVGSDGLASAQITWNTGASEHTYYVWIEATSENGCSNYRYVEVNPQLNQFDLLSENIPADNTVSCPAVASADGFNPSAGSYTAGYTSLQFKVTRKNGTANNSTADTSDTYDWSFIPQLVVDPDLGLTNVIITVEGTNSGVVTADTDSRYLISGSDDAVTVTVSVENAPGYDLDVTLKVTEQKEDQTNLSDSDPSNDNVTHTIEIMPVIDGMGGA